MINIDNISIASISFIFADGYKENYYKYAINSLENTRIIPKETLIKLLIDKCKCMDVEKLQYYTDRYMPFVFDNNTKKISSFEITNEIPSDKELKQKHCDEIKKQLIHHESISKKFENIFNKRHINTNFNNLWNHIRN